MEGIFASGDVVLGAKTVVEAVAYSKTVAEANGCLYEGKKPVKKKSKRRERTGRPGITVVK